MIWSVAWRNIWRNKLRSIIVIFAVVLGIFSGLFSWAFYKGMAIQRISSAISTESSHIQVHANGYLENPDQSIFIENADSLKNIVVKDEWVKAVSERIIVGGMASSARNVSGVKVFGIDPEAEKKVTNIYNKISEGQYFEGIKRNPIVIGKKLAEKLNVKIRSTVIINLQRMNGSVNPVAFRIAGIYDISNSAYEEMNVFVSKSDLSPLIDLNEKGAHEIAILLTDNEITSEKGIAFSSLMDGFDVKTWRELMPDVSLIEQSMDMYMIIFMFIILFALLFGIINTMLMAVLERVKELGMLMAIGMNKLRVFYMIMLETIMLSITGGIAGIILGYLITFLTMKKGIDLSMWAQGYERLGYDTLIYPAPEVYMGIVVAIMVIFTGIIGSIYPAIKALTLKPAEAVRTDV